MRRICVLIGLFFSCSALWGQQAPADGYEGYLTYTYSAAGAATQDGLTYTWSFQFSAKVQMKLNQLVAAGPSGFSWTGVVSYTVEDAKLDAKVQGKCLNTYTLVGATPATVPPLLQVFRIGGQLSYYLNPGVGFPLEVQITQSGPDNCGGQTTASYAAPFTAILTGTHTADSLEISDRISQTIPDMVPGALFWMGRGSSVTEYKLTPINPKSVLSIAKTHSGNFTQGQQGVAYTVTVSNAAWAAPTTGVVTVTESVAPGLALVSMAGSGWSCTGASCTRGDPLIWGASYPPITVTVNVAPNAASPQVNSVSVSGGGSATANASDSTTINSSGGASPRLSITKTHAGNFTQGQQGAAYTIAVSNAAGAGPTLGVVTVTEIVPPGLALVSMVGSGWSCTLASCTRSDSLNGGASYPPITVTVNVAPDAAASLTNQATVSGGGSASATASDPTTVSAGPCQYTASSGGIINLSNTVSNPPAVPIAQTSTIQLSAGPGCSSGNSWNAASGSYWLQILSGGGANSGSAAVISTQAPGDILSAGSGASAGSISIQGLSNTLSVARSTTVTITPTGPNAGPPTLVTVNQPGSAGPLLNRQVTALYQTILGRDPDPPGYAFWTGQGTAGLGVMVDGFTTSPEGFGTNFNAVAVYHAALARAATIAEFASAVANLRNGSATVSSLLASLNPALTTAQVYQNLLGRAPDSAEAALSASAAFTTVTTSAEFQNTGNFTRATDHSNSLYVEMLYYIILTRALDGAGFNFWVGAANSGGPGIYFNGPVTFASRFQILGPGAPNQGFVGSPEFQSHF